MNKVLKKRVTEALEVLPEGEQSRLAEIIGAHTDHFRHALQHDEALKDPAYRAYVETSLDQAEADRQAGRFAPMEDTMTDLKAKFKADHCL